MLKIHYVLLVHTIYVAAPTYKRIENYEQTKTKHRGMYGLNGIFLILIRSNAIRSPL